MNKFDVIVFDLDSTLVKIEGLDWLAQHLGKGQKVLDLTNKSMEGLIGVEEAMDKKMKIISPSYMDLVALGNKYCTELVEGAKELIDLLHKAGKEVWIVTGNFQPAVEIVAKELKIPINRIICNEVYFDKNGNYRGFNKDNPVSKNGGKAQVVRNIIKNDSKAKIVFIGDAITDLETKDDVDLFIGFGGVNIRSVVKEQSDVYIKSKNLLSLQKFII